MDYQIELKFKKLSKLLEDRFDGDVDFSGVLFLIGVNELGEGFRKFTKDQKLDLMHIAICTLLEPYGYYEFEGKDRDNWPHFKLIKKLPPLEDSQQKHLLKESIIEYFLRNEYFTEEQLKVTQ